MHIPAVPYRKHFIEKEEISIFYGLCLGFDFRQTLRVLASVRVCVLGVRTAQVRLGLPLKYV